MSELAALVKDDLKSTGVYAELQATLRAYAYIIAEKGKSVERQNIIEMDETDAMCARLVIDWLKDKGLTNTKRVVKLELGDDALIPSSEEVSGLLSLGDGMGLRELVESGGKTHTSPNGVTPAEQRPEIMRKASPTYEVEPIVTTTRRPIEPEQPSPDRVVECEPEAEPTPQPQRQPEPRRRMEPLTKLPEPEPKPQVMPEPEPEPAHQQEADELGPIAEWKPAAAASDWTELAAAGTATWQPTAGGASLDVLNWKASPNTDAKTHPDTNSMTPDAAPTQPTGATPLDLTAPPSIDVLGQPKPTSMDRAGLGGAALLDKPTPSKAGGLAPLKLGPMTQKTLPPLGGIGMKPQPKKADLQSPGDPIADLLRRPASGLEPVKKLGPPPSRGIVPIEDKAVAPPQDTKPTPVNQSLDSADIDDLEKELDELSDLDDIDFDDDFEEFDDDI